MADDIPSLLKYTKNHEWARREADGTVTIGITDHAQAMLGDLVFIELPAIGKHVDAGAEVAVVESVKAAADVYAPLAGEVSSVNLAAADAPERVNQMPYETWMFRLVPDNGADFEAMMDAAAYRRILQDEQH